MNICTVYRDKTSTSHRIYTQSPSIQGRYSQPTKTNIQERRYCKPKCETCKAFIRDTRRYSPLRRFTSSSCRGLRPSAQDFFALCAKKEFFTLFVLILGLFWCSVITSIMFSSNLNNFENNQKKSQKIQPHKIQKSQKKSRKIIKLKTKTSKQI